MLSKHFTSSQIYDHQLRFNSICGYTRYHFALLTNRGITGIFDFLRYERAFLVRRSDLDSLLAAFSNPAAAVLEPIQIMIAALGDKRTPAWTLGRLLRPMQLSDLSLSDAIQLGSSIETSTPKTKLKIRSDITVNGDCATVLKIMWHNFAMPCTEKDAHEIEAWAYHPDTKKEIQLTKFVTHEQEWIVLRS